MIDQQKIYEFALEWIGIFENPDTREGDIDVRLGEECADLEFVMDCGKSFEERYSFEAFTDPTVFSEIAESIDDAAFLGCAIFSKWRGITYWWNQNLLEPRNRVWFKFALMRLAELIEPEDEEETYECFRGTAERIYLESNNICFGPRPESDEEVEQHLELSASGVGKLRRYMVKVAMFRVVDQYTREDKCVVISKCPVSKPLREAKAFVNECLAKHFACVAECEEKGPMPTAMADMLLAACQKADSCVLVFDMLNEEEAAS